MIVFCTIIYFVKFETFPVCSYSPKKYLMSAKQQKKMFQQKQSISHQHKYKRNVVFLCHMKSLEKDWISNSEAFLQVRYIFTMYATQFLSLLFSNNCQKQRENVLLNSSEQSISIHSMFAFCTRLQCPKTLRVLKHLNSV